MQDSPSAEQLVGRLLLDRERRRAGRIAALYEPQSNSGRNWVLVKFGLFRTLSALVPGDCLDVTDRGIVAGFAKPTIRSAPHQIPPPQLDEAVVSELCDHYGVASENGQQLRDRLASAPG